MAIKTRFRNKIPAEVWAVWGIIAIFAVLFSALALNRHAAFETNGFDLGNVNQAVWNSAHGNLLAFTNMSPIGNRLALHVEPVLLLFAPFYWLGIGGAEFLLVAQAVIVSLGAWPLFLIARPKIGGWGAVMVSLAYLLYPALEAAELFDFHAVTLAPTFFLFGIYYLEIILGRIAPPLARPPKFFIFHFSFFILLALMCKEDMGLVLAMVGVWVWLAHRRKKVAAVLFLGGLAWSLAAVFLIQPQFAAGGNIQGGRYGWLADALSNPQLIWAHLRQVNLPRYFWALFAPVGGLALLSPVMLLPILPSLAINLLSDFGFMWRPEEFHYVAPLAPFIFLAALATLETIKTVKCKIQNYSTFKIIHYSFFAAFLLISTLTYHYFHGFTPLARPFQWRSVTAHQRLGAEMAAAIPPEIPLFAPLNLNPHVSSRAILHQEFDAITPEDWVWVDVASMPNDAGGQFAIHDRLLPNYETVWAADGYLLLKPPNSSFAIRHSSFGTDFLSFTRVDDAPQYPLAAQFGDALELTGVSVRFNRAESPLVTTFWRALKPLPAGLQPVLFLLDESGVPKGATLGAERSPTLIWYPPEKWTVGETVAVSFRSVVWEARQWQNYRLAVGVIAADDPWEPAARLQPSVGDSAFAVRSAGGLVELGRFHQLAGMQTGGAVAREFSAPKVGHPQNENFGGQVRLAGYDTPQVSDSAVTVRLVWQGIGGERENWTRFVHLVGADGGLRGQMDSAPDGGAYPTGRWADGEFVADTVTIPLENPLLPGEYRLAVGLYNPADGARLPLDSGGDHVEIGFSVR